MSGTFDPWRAIPREEFYTRQDRARQKAIESSLDGLVVYSKGGGSLDMHADVLYLANHYSPIPYVSDHFGLGTARSHGVLVLPVDAPSILIVDTPYYRRDLVAAGEVRVDPEVTRQVGQTLHDRGLLGKRLGLVGTSYMSASAYRGFLSKIDGTPLVIADELVEGLRRVKSPAERNVIREGARIASQALQALLEAALPGTTEGEAVTASLDLLVPQGAVLYDAAISSGPDSNLFTPSRLPSWNSRKRLARGDIFHVDFYGGFGGYLWDIARSRVIGDSPTEEQHQMMETAIQGVEFICRAIRPRVSASQIYTIGQEYLAASPLFRRSPWKDGSLPSFCGHGVGLSWEKPLLEADCNILLEPGMFLAVELFLTHPEKGGVLFEQNGFVTEDGFHIITECPNRW